MLSMVTGQTMNPLNHSMIFLKTKDIIMTNDVWRIVLDLNLRPYEDIISTLRRDLQLVHNGTEPTVVNELEQVDLLLDELEIKLSSMGQFTPKLDPRRGVVEHWRNVSQNLVSHGNSNGSKFTAGHVGKVRVTSRRRCFLNGEPSDVHKTTRLGHKY
jgi:hypothetical protein